VVDVSLPITDETAVDGGRLNRVLSTNEAVLPPRDLRVELGVESTLTTQAANRNRLDVFLRPRATSAHRHFIE